MEHKHAKLLRMAADNADQLFECDEYNDADISAVTSFPDYNWRPVAKPKKTITRWLWCTDDGDVGSIMMSDEEHVNTHDPYKTKLLWSETEFEVEE